MASRRKVTDKWIEWESREHTVTHVTAAPPGWRLVYVAGSDDVKTMLCVDIAAFVTGSYRPVQCKCRRDAKGNAIQPTRRKPFPPLPATGVLVFQDAGIDLCSHIEWLTGNYDWLFDQRIAGVCPPGGDPKAIYKEGVADIEKYQEKRLPRGSHGK